ncbi:MAG: gp16 family protein [Panacagrimonas sp.]
MSTDPRNRELAKIHILKAQLGLDDDQYRTMLHVVARVESSKDLDTHGRRQVIEHLEAHAKRAGIATPPARQKPADAKARLVAKVRAILINAPGGRRDDAYADAMAQRMFGVARFTWCDPQQLYKLVGALMIDQKRHVAEPPPGPPRSSGPLRGVGPVRA